MLNISIAKTAGIIKVDWDKLPDNAKAYIIEYGLKQRLNDASSSITKDVEPDAAKRAAQKVAIAEQVYAELLQGNVSTRGAGSGMTLEESLINKWLRQKYKEIFGVKVSDIEDTSTEALLPAVAQKLKVNADKLAETLATKAEQWAEQERKLREMAAKAKAEADIDLEDLTT